MRKIFLFSILFILALNFAMAENISVNETTNYNCYYISSNLKCSNQTFLYQCKDNYFDTKNECLNKLFKLDQQPALIRDIRLNARYIGEKFYPSNPTWGFISLVFLIGLIIYLIKYFKNKKIRLK
jgi:hypothetical protein